MDTLELPALPPHPESRMMAWSKTEKRAIRAYTLAAIAANRAARPSVARFQQGDRVRKISGAEWQGHVVGQYSTALTPEGYAVESESHPGSVQIYPAAALQAVP